jgi:hypothetical protein
MVAIARNTLFLALVAACSGAGGPPLDSPDRILVAAGMVPLEPLAVDTVSAGVDLSRLGVERVSRVYDVSTPPGESFSMNVLSRAPGNAGPVRLSVAHGSDGGATPLGGPESMGDAGILPEGHGPEADGPWLEVTGDGYVRLGLSGAIAAEQVLALAAETADGSEVVLVRIGLGGESIINRNGPDAPVEEGDPDVIQTATLYSSDLDLLAAPAVACAGDVTTVVAYDGNRADPDDGNTYEIRLRHDRATNTVVGGGTTSLGEEEWFGEWRDHEVAARGSVLAVARASDERVTLRISFDGGATFAQANTLASGYDEWSFRLAQVALGPSHELALVYWRVNSDYTNHLVLVEGVPSARNAAGEPTAYAFGGERILFQGGEFAGPGFENENLEDFVPLVIGAQYSEGGDLVIAYAFTDFIETEEGESAIMETRCLTRLAGRATFDEALVEHEDDVIGFDPSVAVLGEGETMAVFIAYEASDGVRMRVSHDGGRTFSEAGVAGGPGAHLPSVFARAEDGATRVDLLYVTWSDWGNELHVRHWDDFGNTPSRDYRLVGAGPDGDFQQGYPGDPGYVPGTYVEKQLGWFGYDAALSGDDIVVVCVEETIDYYRIFAMEEPVPAEEMPEVDDTCGCVPPAGDELYLRTLKLIRLD